MVNTLAGTGLSTLNITNIQEESYSANTGNEVISIPGTEAASQLAFNLGGVSGRVDVSGEFVNSAGGGPASLKSDFVDLLRAFVTASKDINYRVTYTSEIYGTIYGALMGVEFKWNAGDVNSVHYSFSVVQAV